MLKLTKQLQRMCLLAALAGGCAWGAFPPQEIKVAYSIIPVPAAMLPEPTENIGVLVIVQTAVGSIGKIEVRVDYVDDSGEIHEVRQTVSRKQTIGGFDPSPIPILFMVPAVSVAGVYANGYSPSLVPQVIVALP